MAGTPMSEVDPSFLITMASPGFSDIDAEEEEQRKKMDKAKKLTRKWEMKYQEAAIYLQEGFENDQFEAHPNDQAGIQAYRFVHSTSFHVLDLFAAILLMLLALVEQPAVDRLEMPIQGHALVELLLLVVLAMDLAMRIRWLKWKGVVKYNPRVIFKTIFLLVMVIEAIVVVCREKSHFRITRGFRPLFLLDTYYCMGARRVARQIGQSLPPIIDMFLLLFFVMIIFSVFGFFLFSDHPNDPNFRTFKDSFISLFILVTTANYPDVMMPAYYNNGWAPLFFIAYLSITLYLLLNLLMAVVYSTFQEFEKKKFCALYLHRRLAVRKMFSSLCGKHRTAIAFVHFAGLMRYYKPSLDKLALQCAFKWLNKSGTGALSLKECYSIYQAIAFKWQAINAQQTTEQWYSYLPHGPLTIVKSIEKVVNHNIFRYFINFVLASNMVFMIVQAVLSGTEFRNDPISSLVFVSIYTVEACLKMVGLGPRNYFQNSWNVFDFVIVIISLIGIVGESSHLRLFVFLRPLRLLRLFSLKKRYRDVLATMFVLLPRMGNVLLLLVVLYYFFAVIGMEWFGGLVQPGCCKNSAVASYYSAGNDTVYYYLNNFDNILQSYVTLFELMVVNNWFVIMNGFVSVTNEWARLYFMTFYLVTVMVVTIVIAFILDAFLVRIASNSPDRSSDSNIEGDYCRDKVTLERYEIPRHRLNQIRTSQSIRSQIRFQGTRRMTKMDLNALMYHDEVKEWIAKDECSEDESTSTMMSDCLEGQAGDVQVEGRTLEQPLLQGTSETATSDKRPLLAAAV